MADAVQKREYQFPSTVRDAGEQYSDIINLIKSLEKRRDALKEFLIDKVVPKGLQISDEEPKKEWELEGVKVLMWISPRPSYAKVLEQLKDEGVIPRKWFDRVDAVIKENTKNTTSTKVSIEDIEREYGGF